MSDDVYIDDHSAMSQRIHEMFSFVVNLHSQSIFARHAHMNRAQILHSQRVFSRHTEHNNDLKWTQLEHKKFYKINTFIWPLNLSHHQELKPAYSCSQRAMAGHKFQGMWARSDIQGGPTDATRTDLDSLGKPLAGCEEVLGFSCHQ